MVETPRRASIECRSDITFRHHTVNMFVPAAAAPACLSPPTRHDIRLLGELKVESLSRLLHIDRLDTLELKSLQSLRTPTTQTSSHVLL